ncbi:MAG: enterochelin esterase-like enzyme [Rhodothermales bacterium]|jgi:enterochelin esterase-like enzyme
MTMAYRFFLALVAVGAFANAAHAQGTVSEDQRIESEALGYALQYRVYTPAGYDGLSDLPTLYLADGQWYLAQGGYAAILDKLI